MIALATVAGDAIADAGKAVDVAKGASGWLHNEGGYALAAIFLAAWIAERALSVMQRRRSDADLDKAHEALGRANEQTTRVLVELLRHEREADDTPPPGKS
jgi:hypothetical protein